MTHHNAEPGDVESVDAIMEALYDTISFGPGEEPDWDRLRSLFLEDGSLVPPRDPSEDSTQILGIEALKERGFRETEISRRTDTFANVAHILSIYEGRFSDHDGAFDTRGVNSVQLLFEKDRWWVIGIVWADETDEQPIPEQFFDEDQIRFTD